VRVIRDVSPLLTLVATRGLVLESVGTRITRAKQSPPVQTTSQASLPSKVYRRVHLWPALQRWRCLPALHRQALRYPVLRLLPLLRHLGPQTRLVATILSTEAVIPTMVHIPTSKRLTLSSIARLPATKTQTVRPGLLSERAKAREVALVG